MQNVVPATAGVVAGVAERVASRTLAGRSEVSVDEVQRLVDAGFAVMRRTGTIDPRVGDIVRTAGLSNQAFYRHFSGKDELLLACLEDGQRRLVSYLEHRLAAVGPGAPQVRRWIEGVLEQARNADAAENTRAFAINGARLGDRFPEELARLRELVVAPLREAVAGAGGDARRDADAISTLAIAAMEDALVARRRPSKADVEHLVEFALKGMR